MVYGLNGFLVYGLGRYVITPYNEYPQLLGLLLKMLNGELVWSTRREVLKVAIYGQECLFLYPLNVLSC